MKPAYHFAYAKKLRDRAEECRNIAQTMAGRPAATAAYLQLAKAYDLLADQEEELARGLAT